MSATASASLTSYFTATTPNNAKKDTNVYCVSVQVSQKHAHTQHTRTHRAVAVQLPGECPGVPITSLTVDMFFSGKFP